MSIIAALKRSYLYALRSAQSKDPTIKYRHLKADPSTKLVFNIDTYDGMFLTALEARSNMPEGYLEVYPWIQFADTAAKNQANLAQYGWPDYESEGV